MTTYRGAFSGSGKDPIPAKGKSSVEGALLSGDFEQPPLPGGKDFAGGRTARAPKGPVERGSTSGDEPRNKASS